MEGGGIIGEGVHGIAYDLCLSTSESFCDLVDKLTITEVTLYTVDGPKKINNDDFLTLVHRRGKYYAKVLKPKGPISLSSAKKEFLQEIQSNRLILELLDDSMVTVFPNELGAHIKGSKEIYVIFGKKCNNVYSVNNIKKFGKDILEMLVVLNKKYAHNDIKPDNIVKCGTKFKLIDWGAVSQIDKITSKASITTSPMKVYLEYGFAYVTKNIFASKLSSSIKNNPKFKEQYTRIMKEFEEEINSTKVALKKKFHATHDVFQLGITMIYVIISEDLDYEKARPLIEKLTSLKEPLTAEQAISLF
jgi:serine/threonine protein kinase